MHFQGSQDFLPNPPLKKSLLSSIQSPAALTRMVTAQAPLSLFLWLLLLYSPLRDPQCQVLDTKNLASF